VVPQAQVELILTISTYFIVETGGLANAWVAAFAGVSSPAKVTYTGSELKHCQKHGDYLINAKCRTITSLSKEQCHEA
jgi:hypothetical protein